MCSVDKNKKRTSKKQFQIYIKYLNENEILKTGKLKPWDVSKDIGKIWEEMAADLNASGDGPIRSSQEWKKVFREWKSAVRKKAREQKELNHTEQQLVELTGTVAVAGFQIPELANTVEVCETGDGVENAASTECDILELENAPDEEVLFLEDEHDVASSTKKKGRNKKPDNPLLTAYIDGQENERNGLSEIARALDSIAQGINRFCDLYEAKHEIYQ